MNLTLNDEPVSQHRHNYSSTSKYAKRKSGNYSSINYSTAGSHTINLATSQTSRIPKEPSIPKPSITPKSKMMKRKQKSPK